MSQITTISRFTVLKNRKKILKNPLPFHHHNFEKYGDTFRINLGRPNTWVFTRNPKSIKHILQKNHRVYGKSLLQTKDLAKYVGHGLLTSNGSFWRKHRRMIQPAFHKKKLAGLVGIMHKAIKMEMGFIKENETHDIFSLMGDLAFQVVAQSLFSADNIRQQIVRLKEITMTNQKMLVKEMRLPYLRWWFNLRGEIQEHLNQSKEAKALLNALIQERVDSKEDKDDLLDMLLHAQYEDGTTMSREQLIDEVMILFVAGFETTANALSFTLFLIAAHPEIQEKLLQEVHDFDASSGDMMALFGKLEYTKQCIEEAMRLYPPAYFIDRQSSATDEVGGQKFEAGTVWLMSIYELHRHHDFWKNAEEYIPERFDPTNKKDHSDYYFPFGAGPRMCVGNNFAMFEMMLTVAEIVKKYQLKTESSKIEINPLITLKPAVVPLKFIPR